MDEQKLAKELETYRDLAQQDKNIDVAGLMIQALQKQQQNQLTGKEKRWGYLVSISVPPFGLIYAAKFYFSGKDDGKEGAWICMILTAVSILMFLILGKVILGASNVSLNQIQQIKPSDIQSLYQQ